MHLVSDNSGRINPAVVAALLDLGGVTQADAASWIGVNPSGVTRRMKGKSRWGAEEVYEIAKRLDVPTDTFYLSTKEALDRIRRPITPGPDRDTGVTDGYLQLVTDTYEQVAA